MNALENLQRGLFGSIIAIFAQLGKASSFELSRYPVLLKVILQDPRALELVVLKLTNINVAVPKSPLSKPVEL